MKCKDVIREISEYLDGQLDATMLAELERHLGHCEDCKLIVDTTRKTIEVFCNSQPAPLDSSVRQRLHSALQQRLQRRPS